MIRIYQFYNMKKSENGAPFALCDDCRATQPIPKACVLECIADQARWPCGCGKVNNFQTSAKEPTP